jgi:hypothetical protein
MTPGHGIARGDNTEIFQGRHGPAAHFIRIRRPAGIAT